MFPAATDIGQWLVSAPLTADIAPRAAKGYQLPADSAGLVDIRVIGLEICGLHADGAVTCRGPNRWWQCEPGQTRCSHASGTEVFRPDGTFTAITAGRDFYGLRADGTVTCWKGEPAPINCFLHQYQSDRKSVV